MSAYIPAKPSITCRRAKFLKDQLVQSHFVDPRSLSNQPATTIPCGNCEACPFLDLRNKVILPNGQFWTQKRAATCHSSGVIYLLSCPCGDFYIGKTRRQLSMRIREHVTSATSGFFRTVIGRHFALKHEYNFTGIKFLPLTIIECPDRGGDWDQLLLQAETRWIFRLKADCPPGLNECISYASFL